ncbi:MAG: UvrD-helicase domain-containing protein [Candidatus Latescibacteria bacterium]|nr:UvrD-helicase domain-containing protein [Candidatus Latescibacterota bacterium]
MAEELGDQAARRAIVRDLHQNLMVLAGAGAGKTQALVERMAAWICTGQGEVEQMAAITFTRKAAGEMRARFAARLQTAAGQGGPEAERARRALDRLDRCFVGTIHSFCGQLLRERPLEAGLPADFSELEEREEGRLRRAAWDRFVQQGHLREDEGWQQLEEVGLQAEDLYPFFSSRCAFGDLPLKSGAAPCPDLGPAVTAVRELVDQALPWMPAGTGGDPAAASLTRARHFLDNVDLHHPGDQVALLRLLAGNPKVTLKAWKPNEAFAKTLRDELLPALQEEVLAPVLAQWRRHAYAAVVPLVDEAARFYAGQRRSQGRLSFQDLLELAALLLRDQPQVRRHFQQRFHSLFVDEFQDTDPIQAQVVFYLTGTDPDESDWTRLNPRPGSLFLVGDEKQSIYRFRRADVETCARVRQRLAQSGGQVVELNTSFRAAGPLCAWLNQVFAPLFAAQPPPYQASFAPLVPHRTQGGDPVGVRRLPIAALKGHRRAQVAALEAESLAAFIAAVLAGQTEFNTPEVLGERVGPGDFMILTRTTSCLPRYARALEARGIPYDIVGSRLSGSADLKALVEMVEAIAAPRDALSLVKYLRGPLVGLGDDEFYAFKKAGGIFDHTQPLPEGVDGALRLRLEGALGRLLAGRRWFESHSAATAWVRLIDELGLSPFAATRPAGSSRAGSLLRVVALVRQWAGQGLHWVQILRELRELLDDPDYKVEEMTLQAGQSGVVRLMNLHQAKGLQARVVCLADPCDTSAGRHEVEFHVSRTGAQPFLSRRITRPRGPHAVEVIGEPVGWEEAAREEARFLAAEELRLLYVAATRARDLLVVSCYEGKTDAGPWAALYPALERVPALPVYEVPRPDLAPAVVWDWAALAQQRRERWVRAAQPSSQPWPCPGEQSRYGGLVCQLLGAIVEGRLPEEPGQYLEQMLGEAGLPADQRGRLEQVLATFRASALWAEVQVAAEAYTEVQFAAPEDGQGGVRGTLDLVFRVAGGWKIVDYQNETQSERAALEAGVRAWQKLAGEPVVARGVWHPETGIWQEL